MTRQKTQFRSRLKTLAKTMEHATLAAHLGVGVKTMQNWLYKPIGPEELLVTLLTPKLDEIYAKSVK